MKKIKFANTDLFLSRICYGTGNFGEKLTKAQAFETLDAFVDAGGNFIDTANVYCKWVGGLGNSSEQYIGAWLKERNAYDKIVIATKGGHYDFAAPNVSRVNKREVEKDLDESLRTLGLEHIDFYWLHRDDESADIREIVDMMEEFVSSGKIRYYGASNYKRYRMEQARQYAKEKGIRGFSAVSNQWSMASVSEGGNMNQDASLVMMDHDYYNWHAKEQMPIVPFSSSAHGFFDKYHQGAALSEEMKRAYLNEKNMEIYQELQRLSGEYGTSLYALTIAWLLAKPFQVFPVAAVSKASQLRDFIEADEITLEKDFTEKFIP